MPVQRTQRGLNELKKSTGGFASEPSTEGRAFTRCSEINFAQLCYEDLSCLPRVGSTHGNAIGGFLGGLCKIVQIVSVDSW